MSTNGLISLAIDINADIKMIKELYPNLQDFNIIKRLINKSDKWYNLLDKSTSTAKEGGF